MTKKTSKQLLASVLSLTLCLVMLIGTTFAWFTDTATTAVNSIQSGTLDVDLVDAAGNTLVGDTLNFISNGAEKTDILWEPGCTYELENVYIKNKGNLALKYKIEISGIEGDAKLLEAIDWTIKLGNDEISLDTFVGELTPGTVTDVLRLTGHMDENAGNEYQNLNITGIAIRVIATQQTYESDSFDDQYDVNADLDFVPVSGTEELRIALENKVPNILLTKDCYVDETLNINYEVNINGGGYDIYRSNGVNTFSTRESATEYTGVVFTVKSGAVLVLENTTVDGAAIWTGEVNEVLGRGTVNDGVVATGALISTEGNGVVVLNSGAVLQNNDGANAVSLATRGGGSLTVNGGKILNNTSASGAIWGGGDITINSGSLISGNHATSIGGVVRTVDGQKKQINFTMNGGTIKNNYSSTTGGVIWSGNHLNVYFNGGKVYDNGAASAGGVIWGGSYDKYYISGDFEMYNNTGGELCNAIRFNNAGYPSLEMTGGKVYNNKSEDVSNAFYCLNNPITLAGGQISDDILYTGGVGLTIGDVELDGVVHFDLSTNHNTAYLAKEFNTFKFTVNEADEHFGNFNFKPASDYVYTEGDETKLICMNDGYSTYWDVNTNTFRLAPN